MGATRVARRAGIAWWCALLAAVIWSPEARVDGSVRVEVAVPPIPAPRPPTGRLIVTAIPADRGATAEPRTRVGRVGRQATPFVAVDVSAQTLIKGGAVSVGEGAAAFPDGGLNQLAAGDYDVQAVLDLTQDLQMLAAPGNYYSRPVRVTLDLDREMLIRLDLTERVPDERLPPDTTHVRFVRLRSERLSAFHGRPIFLRAAVIVPRGFDQEPDRRYPVRVSVGGFGQRYTTARRAMRDGTAFRAAWLADETPRMLRVMLDGAGPYGDPYQVNSANNGPYGDAVTRELIPHIEERFRGMGTPSARVVDGMSTGGWVALALQIFYPDDFNGAWAFCPDSVDFRAFQRVNIYGDDNAYRDEVGDERPSRRATNGEVLFTMRHELQMENALGRGDRWSRSGRQWGSWNAAYGPRGRDGHPVPLWDPQTGVIDRDLTVHWEQYDLRLVLARRWPRLRSRLDGKLHIWVGEMDDYYLNEAVQLLDAFLQETDPAFRVQVTYGAGQGHCWVPYPESALLRVMGERVGARP